MRPPLGLPGGPPSSHQVLNDQNNQWHLACKLPTFLQPILLLRASMELSEPHVSVMMSTNMVIMYVKGQLQSLIVNCLTTYQSYIVMVGTAQWCVRWWELRI